MTDAGVERPIRRPERADEQTQLIPGQRIDPVRDDFVVRMGALDVRIDPGIELRQTADAHITD